MKRYTSVIILILALWLLAAAGKERVVAPVEKELLKEELLGIWKFPVDGYYLGFDEEGQLCYGGSEESVADKRWCYRYTLTESTVTETCMGGPEDQNCPLGGGICKARVSTNNEGQLQYQILPDQCNMLAHRLVPPRQYFFTRD